MGICGDPDSASVFWASDPIYILELTRGKEDLWDDVMSPMKHPVPRSFLLTVVIDSLGCLTQVSLWMNLVMWDTYSPYQPLVLSHICAVLAGWCSNNTPQSIICKDDGGSGRHYLSCALI